jgi:hypothetical protein
MLTDSGVRVGFEDWMGGDMLETLYLLGGREGGREGGKEGTAGCVRSPGRVSYINGLSAEGVRCFIPRSKVMVWRYQGMREGRWPSG